MATPSAIYRAAVTAATVEHNRAIAELRAGGLRGEELATASRSVEQAFIRAGAAAFSAYEINLRKGALQ